MIEQFQNIFTPEFTDSIIKISVAMILGMILGIEREISNKDAGIKTHVLVCLGSCLYIIINSIMVEYYGDRNGLDPLRMASYLAVAIGFLGSGIIIYDKNKNLIEGLSTAGNIWLGSAIGIACGFGLFKIAIFVTILSVLLFTGLKVFYKIIKWIKKKK